MMTRGGEGLKRALLVLANLVWEWEEMPVGWSRVRAKYLYKGKGDRREYDRSRPVSLISCVGKIVSMLWYRRVEEEIECKINEGQAGFRKNRGVRDVWWVLEGVIQSRLKRGLKTYVGFIDFKKAFDRVWREGLWWKLEQKGVKGKMWRMIQRWYEGSEVKAEWMGAETGWMKIDLGVRQGCVLSGLLFAVYVDDVFEWLDVATDGVTIGEGEEWEEIVRALMYADDLTMMAKDAEGMLEMLEILRQWSKQWRMDVSAGLEKEAKSEVVVFGEKGIEKENGWRLGEEEVIKELEWARLLGVEMDDMLKMEKYRKGMAQKTGGMMLALREIGRVMGEQAAMKGWRSFMRTRLLYGCEVFVWWTKKMRGDMDRVQREVWRKMLGLERGANNALLYGEVGEKKLSTMAEELAGRYGDRMKREEQRNGMLGKMMRIREENRKDRWMKEKRRVEASVTREEGQSLAEVLKERDEREWRAGLERSRERLVVYKRTVSKMGDGERWGKMEYRLRRWWRAFRGGLLHGGNRKKYKWQGGMLCEWCGDEKGGVEHWVMRCSAIEEARRALLEKCGEIMGGWGQITREKRVVMTMGGRGECGWDKEKLEEMWSRAAEMWREVYVQRGGCSK
jgi:hypothetical protein